MTIKECLSHIVENLFFETDSRLYWMPEQFAMHSEAFETQAVDGSILRGLLIPSQGKNQCSALGTVIYCHAKVKNLSYNLPQILWLCSSGFNVIGFDYRGCGQSTGDSSLEGMQSDVQSILNWSRKRLPDSNFILFGQGPGADAALRCTQENQDRLKGLILESLYADCRGWLLDRYGPGVGHLAAYLMPEQSTQPETLLKKTTLPLAVFFSRLDQYNPKKQIQQVLNCVSGKASVCEVNHGGYGAIFLSPGKHMLIFIDFAKKVLSS